MCFCAKSKAHVYNTAFSIYLSIFENLFSYVNMYRLCGFMQAFFCVCSSRQRGWLARRLSYVLFVVERDVHKDMFTRNVVDNVLNNSR